MLSYRHGYHAGNHADVLTHIVLIQLARYMGQKDKPFTYVDTHAGGGTYDLESAFASKLGEYREGIRRLWETKGLPAAVAEYVSEVRALNPDGRLRRYPGSPWSAARVLREQDRLRLFELHSKETRLLAECFKDAGKRVVVEPCDGFAGLKAVLPPPSRRGLVLIDPSYEDKRDYARVVTSVREGLARFATGCYAIWYPQVQRRESHDLPEKLARLPGIRWLHASLTVRKPSPDGLGLHGSGMFVINPPWTLRAALDEALPWLAGTLAQDDGARWSLDGTD